MSLRRRNLSISLLVLVAVVSITIWSTARRRHTEVTREEALAQRHALSEQARRWEERLVAAKKSSSGGVTNAESPASAAPDVSTRPAVRPSPLSVLMADPKLQAEYFKSRRANLPFLYGPLFATLGLSMDQKRQLEEVMMRREEMFFDTVATVPAALNARNWYGGGGAFQRQNFLLSAVSDPLETTTPETRAAATLLQQNEAEFRQMAATLIGSERVQQLLQYERTMPIRDTVDSLGATLVQVGEPLTVAQSNQLTQILAGTIPGFIDGAHARPDRIDWEQALSRAAEVLSPSQLAAMRTQGAYDMAGKSLQIAIEKVGGFSDKPGTK
jgi:hypothetical protein